jgi:serine/threonine-protein kinase
MTPVNPGQILAGKYRVERVLGVGGMGVVVAALHLQLDERVAIKFLLPEALENAEAVARFAREARAAVKIKSLHVARVIDVGTLETGAPYMVMEFLHGQDLSQRLRDNGALPVSDAVDYVLQACEALAEAHALGIVHRDLKPANLFLTRLADGSDCVKVLDFGISKITQPSSSGQDFGMTKTQAIMGSPLYMSPEQMASSRDVDGRSDIWAVGTILYELLARRVPFMGETMPQLCAMILQHPPPPPRTFRPDIPEGLEQVILRCLEKDRNLRFGNVAELAHALVPYGSQFAARSADKVSRVLSAAGISSRELSLSPATAPVEASTSAAWGQTQTRRSRPALWLGIGLAAAAAVGIPAFLLLGGKGAAPGSVASEVASTTTAPPAPPPSEAPAPPAAPSVTVASEIATPAPSASASPSATVASSKKPVAGPTPKRPRPATTTAAPAPSPTPTQTAKKPAFDPLIDRR